MLDYQVPGAEGAELRRGVQLSRATHAGAVRGIPYRSGGQQKQADLDDLLASSDTTSFLVIKDDTIRYEGYFNGYSRDSIVTSFSTAKSITSALIGIAIEESYIDDVKDPLIKYLPEMKGQGFDSMTIRDLLLMSTGIRFSTGDEAGIISTKFPYTALNPYADETASYEHTDMKSWPSVCRPAKSRWAWRSSTTSTTRCCWV